MSILTDDQLQPMMRFYGVSLEEARRRNVACVEQGDDPHDPICIGCARRPHEIEGYVVCCMESEGDPRPTDDEVRLYVIHEEGTYNRANGHFLCDPCYIKNGMPSSDRGWVCP